jgi:O-methyltransferase
VDLEIYKKVKPYTMTCIERIMSLLNVVEYIVKNNIEGDIIKCGVWKGGSIYAVLLKL